MKNTRKNVIELLKKREKDADKWSKFYQNIGDKKRNDFFLGRLNAYKDAIELLTDEEYFNDINDAYKN